MTKNHTADCKRDACELQGSCVVRQLRAQLAITDDLLKTENEVAAKWQQLAERRDETIRTMGEDLAAARAEVARLRGALERMADDTDADGYELRQYARTMLAASPGQGQGKAQDSPAAPPGGPALDETVPPWCWGPQWCEGGDRCTCAPPPGADPCASCGGIWPRHERTCSQWVPPGGFAGADPKEPA